MIDSRKKPSPKRTYSLLRLAPELSGMTGKEAMRKWPLSAGAEHRAIGVGGRTLGGKEASFILRRKESVFIGKITGFLYRWSN